MMENTPPADTEQQRELHDRHGDRETSGSPPRPSYSPFTPTLSTAGLLPPDTFVLPPSEEVFEHETQWMDEPDPETLNMDDNPDAIALRAAISILQSQRKNSLQDLKELESLKKSALAHPQDFLNALHTGRLSSETQHGSGQMHATQKSTQSASLGIIPPFQNVVRCPPIEWSKYHIAADPLDAMHERQRRYPGAAEGGDKGRASTSQKAHVVVAPFRPFTDRLDEKSGQDES